MQFGFVENDPATRPSLATVKRIEEHAEHRRGERVPRCRPRRSDELAVDNFSDQVLGNSLKIGVSRILFCGVGHVVLYHDPGEGHRGGGPARQFGLGNR
jgi:hypothetical protein